MKESPLVSVIVPVYNVEKFLKECVDSIRAQTHDDLEIILVDDGSPDASGKMCDEFAKQDSRIRVIHKANEGLNFARKTGFEHSTGEYILFVDSDDMIRKNTVDMLLTAAQRDDVSLTIGGYSKFTDDEISDMNSREEHVEWIILEKHELIKGLLMGVKYDNILMMTAWGKLFHRSLLETIDWSASNYRVNEDEFMALQYYPVTEKAAIVLAGLYLYRENPDSLTRKQYNNSFNGELLDKYDTIELLYNEGLKRLGDDRKDDILVKFIYEFIVTIQRQIIDDATIDQTRGAIEKYYIPKKKLFTEKVMTRIDQLTRAQHDGLMEGGVVGCYRAKLKFINNENEKLLIYSAELESVIAVQNDTIAQLRGEIAYLKSFRGMVRTPLSKVKQRIRRMIRR